MKKTKKKFAGRKSSRQGWGSGLQTIKLNCISLQKASTRVEEKA